MGSTAVLRLIPQPLLGPELGSVRLHDHLGLAASRHSPQQAATFGPPATLRTCSSSSC